MIPSDSCEDLTLDEERPDRQRFLVALLSRRKLVSYILFALLAVWGAVYILTHLDELAAIRRVSVPWLLLLFALASGKFSSQGLFTKVSVKDLGVNLGFPEWLGLAGLSTMANALTPFHGGAAARAAYLKVRYGLSYSLFLSTLAILYATTFATSAVLGAVAVLLLYASFGYVELSLIAIFGLCLALPVLFVALVSLPSSSMHRLLQISQDFEVRKRWRPAGKFLHSVVQIVAGVRTVHSDWKTTGQLVGLSLLNAFLSLCMVHLSFAVFGSRLPLLASLVLSNLFIISSLIPLTPSGLGIGEFAIVMAAQLFGINTTTSILSAGLNRTVMLCSSLIWGVLLSHLLDFHVDASADVNQELPPQRYS